MGKPFVVGTVLAAALVQFTAPSVVPPAKAAETPEGLVVYFGVGSSSVGSEGEAALDQAARLFREGDPIVMVVSGATDRVGAADRNLRLSARRAQSLLDGLVARGIPVDRLQMVAKGETEPAVATADDVPEALNRRAVITWR